MSDTSPRKSSGSSIAGPVVAATTAVSVAVYSDMTASCPCIEDLGRQNQRRPSSYPTSATPLLSNHIEV